jgi:hypothetical protein
MAVTMRILLMACTLAAGISFLWPLASVEDTLPTDPSPLSVGCVDQDGSGDPPQDLPLHAWATRAGDLYGSIVEPQDLESPGPAFRSPQIPSASPRSPPQVS